MKPKQAEPSQGHSLLLVSLLAAIICLVAIAARGLYATVLLPSQSAALSVLDKEVVSIRGRMVAAIEQSRPTTRGTTVLDPTDLWTRLEALRERSASFRQALEMEFWLASRGPDRKHTALDYIYSTQYYSSRLLGPVQGMERAGLFWCLSRLPGAQVAFDGMLTDLWIEEAMISSNEGEQLMLVAVPRGMARSEPVLTGILHFLMPNNPERVRQAALERLEDYLGNPRADHAIRAALMDSSGKVRREAELLSSRLERD